MNAILWKPIKAGRLQLKHRLAMAPMTRNRATATGSPTELNAEYYAQRASNALIITEGTQPSPQGQGYLLTPGIYTPEHIAGWRKVTDAVHAKGGTIVIQIMHAGRIAHPSNTLHGELPFAPSAIRPNVKMFTATGAHDIPEPRALTLGEIATTVQDFRRAAAAAIAAGADGVEIHGANGYLIQQFLSDNTNQRTDEYGGSVANRIRFAVEVAKAVTDEIGADRTGFRISPGNTFNDIHETNVAEVYTALVRELNELGLAYLHVSHMGDEALVRTIRKMWSGVLLLNRTGTDVADRIADIENGLADVVTIGVATLANPDLVERLKRGAPLNDPDPSTFYGGGAKGYTDYPTLSVATV
jgi:N-ethylmaleimide reductase